MTNDDRKKTPSSSREKLGAEAAAWHSQTRAAVETSEWARDKVRHLVKRLQRMARLGVFL
jgi:hypothetical protein